MSVFRRARLFGTLLVAACALAVVAVATAQSEDAPPRKDLPAAITAATFRDGDNTVSISDEGVMTAFESPNGYQHVFAEGYVLCYSHPSSGAQVAYAYAGSEDGFGPATTTDVTRTGATVTRKTINGLLRFKQVLRLTGEDRTFSITMSLTNLSQRAASDVVVKRVGDLDIDAYGSNGWAGTINYWGSDSAARAFGWETPDKANTVGKEAHSIGLRALNSGVWDLLAAVTDLGDVTTCTPPNVASSGPVLGDYAASIVFDFPGPIGPGQTFAARVAWQRS